MQFVVEYDRQKMVLLSLDSFDDDRPSEAMRRKLDLELLHANDQNVEVALFQSSSESMLRRTHARYFRSARELADSFGES